MTASVLLVDDHELIRFGLRRVFEQTTDLSVVAETSTSSEARILERRHAPDVVLLDLHLRDGQGLGLLCALRTARPELGIVVLTSRDGDEPLFQALECGASAFVLKGASAADVVAATRSSLHCPTAFTTRDLAGAMRRRDRGAAVALTSREREILGLLSLGCSVAAVSGRLYISASTAKTHMSRIYDKLGAQNRTQAVMNAVRLGLIDAHAANVG